MNINIDLLKRIYYRRIYSKLWPVKYANKIGVNILGRLYLYGEIAWGTEPWLITIGDNVHITGDVKFITHDGGTLIFRQYVKDLEITKPITVGNDVYIGNNVLLLPGVSIGDRVVIGAGAVVSKDIPSNSLAVGIPARVIKTADEYFDKLQKESLHLGHLKGQEKDKALMRHYNYNGNSKGIYFYK